MESVLSFFSDLIIFTFGLAVVTFWIAIIFVVVDEIIDLVIPSRRARFDALLDCDCPAHDYRGRECTCDCDHRKDNS